MWIVSKSVSHLFSTTALEIPSYYHPFFSGPEGLWPKIGRGRKAAGLAGISRHGQGVPPKRARGLSHGSQIRRGGKRQPDPSARASGRCAEVRGLVRGRFAGRARRARRDCHAGSRQAVHNLTVVGQDIGLQSRGAPHFYPTGRKKTKAPGGLASAVCRIWATGRQRSENSGQRAPRPSPGGVGIGCENESGIIARTPR